MMGAAILIYLYALAGAGTTLLACRYVEAAEGRIGFGGGLIAAVCGICWPAYLSCTVAYSVGEGIYHLITRTPKEPT